MNALERVVLDHLDQMVFLVEPATLRIVLANQAAERALGHTAEALRGMSILDIECSLQDVFYWEDVRNGQLVDIETEEAMYLCADGTMPAAAKTVRVVEKDGER